MLIAAWHIPVNVLGGDVQVDNVRGRFPASELFQRALSGDVTVQSAGFVSKSMSRNSAQGLQYDVWRVHRYRQTRDLNTPFWASVWFWVSLSAS